MNSEDRGHAQRIAAVYHDSCIEEGVDAEERFLLLPQVALSGYVQRYEEDLQAAEARFKELAAAVEAYREQRHGGKTTFTATATEAAMYRAARGKA